jgi:hypothetical protein
MKVPDYVCLETVQRFARTSPKRSFQPLDTLQLDVGVVSNQEVYSWPGAESFEDSPPDGIVSAGAVSTGEFMQLLRAVFVGGTSNITFAGEEQIRGRRAFRYDYTLPLFGYRARVNLPGGSGDVSLRGSFWADADTLELISLASESAEVPPDLPLASMSSRIGYSYFDVQGSRIWLPESAEVRLLETGGRETLNVIEFSHCRQFSGVSALSFGEPSPPAPAPPAPRLNRIHLPEGVELNLRLESEIDSQRTRVGEAITATLVSDAVYRKAELIPAGAIVTGRVRRLERSSEMLPHFVVGLEFTSIRTGTAEARFYGRLESVQPIAGVAMTLRTSSSSSRRVPTTSTMQGFRVESSVNDTLSVREIPGVGSFFVTGDRVQLPRGFRMSWRTVAPPARGRCARGAPSRGVQAAGSSYPARRGRATCRFASASLTNCSFFGSH